MISVKVVSCLAFILVLKLILIVIIVVFGVGGSFSVVVHLLLYLLYVFTEFDLGFYLLWIMNSVLK